MAKNELIETTESDFCAAMAAPGLRVYTCQIATTGTPERVVALKGHGGRCFVSPEAIRCDASSESRGILT
jgi:hypothetical protein